MSLLSQMSGAIVQGFTNPRESKETKDSMTDFLVVLLAFFLAIALLSLLGKFLWNGVVVELLTIAKPAKSFWQILDLFVFVALLRP